MVELALFFGIPLDPLLQKQLHSPPSPLLALLTQGGDYLTCLTCDSEIYLGKRCPPLPSVEELELIEAHIKSMLQKIFPQTLPFTPILMAIPK